MKHFRLNMVLLLAATLLSGCCAGYMVASGRWAPAVLLLVGACACLFCVMVLVNRLKHTMSTFVSALEMDDRTCRFELGVDDHELRAMSQAMNRVAQLYHKNIMEVETRKLYYDRILRIMTHEMRNSITPVIAMTDDYSRHPSRYDSDTLREMMEVIHDQSLGIKKFLDAYYNLTHLPEPQRAPVKAHDLMKRIHTLTALEEKKRGIGDICSFTVPSDLILDVDADLISQAILNLIRNALDAVAKCDDAQISVTASVSEGCPYISVSDNGTGIPRKILDNLFQPFITTKDGGSGVGLSLSRQIARCHGGDLTLTTSTHGTTAMLTLERCTTTNP